MKPKYDRLIVLKYIDQYWAANYISPSIREILERFEIGSLSTVHRILTDLEGGGHVKIVRGAARGIIPVWIKNAIKEARNVRPHTNE